MNTLAVEHAPRKSNFTARLQPHASQVEAAAQHEELFAAEARISAQNMLPGARQQLIRFCAACQCIRRRSPNRASRSILRRWHQRSVPIRRCSLSRSSVVEPNVPESIARRCA